MQIDHEALVVGAGGAGLWAALELAQAGVSTGVLTKLYPDPLPHRRRPGRRLRLPREPRGGPLGVAHVRHGQGRRLPGRPGRRRGPGPRGGRDRHRARAHGPALQPDAGGQDRPAPVRRAHPQLRRGARQAGLLRGRPHRPHDPADPLPELHQGRGQVLRRVPRRRPPLRGRRRWRRRPRGRRDRLPDRRRRAPHLPGQGRPAGDRRQRPDVPDHLQRPLADRATAWPWPTATGSRCRTWSSTSSTRPASTGWASSSRRRPAARAATS